jgi:hypothetical protein
MAILRRRWIRFRSAWDLSVPDIVQHSWSGRRLRSLMLDEWDEPWFESESGEFTTHSESTEREVQDEDE